MKLVFFDLQRRMARLADASRYSEPARRFGDGARATRRRPSRDELVLQQHDHELLRRQLPRVAAGGHRGLQLQLELRGRQTRAGWWSPPSRTNPELGKTVHAAADQAGRVHDACRRASSSRRAPTRKPWPTTCADIDDAAIQAGDQPAVQVGYMLLNGKRLGNLERDRGDPQQGDHRFPRRARRPSSAQDRRRDRLGARVRATASTAR